MYNLPGQENPCHKVPLLGDASVGKTCLVDYITKKRFNPNTRPNVGVSTASIDMKVKDVDTQLSIWDTAGQETFRSLVPLYTRNAEVILLVFDVTEQTTYASLPKWIEYIRKDLAIACPVFLVANKIDCPFVIDRSDISKMASENNCTLLYTSAKTGQGVVELFQEVANVVAANAKPTATLEAGPQLKSVQTKKGCC